MEPPTSAGSSPTPDPARRLLAVAFGLCLALAAAVAWLWFDRSHLDPRELVEVAISSDEVKRAAMAQLIEGGEGAWDSFPDPDVGRVMQRGITDRDFRGVVADVAFKVSWTFRF